MNPSPSNPAGRFALAFALLATLLALACVAVPMYVIRPFRPQGVHSLAIALALRQSGPILSALCTAIVLLCVFACWRAISTAARVWVVICLTVASAAAVVTHINIFERMFHPYDSPQFEASTDSRVEPDDMVMAIQVGNEAQAFPIRAMGYHHIVNVTIGGIPVAATYCTLCHTGLVWRRVVAGQTLRFRLAGINNGNALMRDEQTSTIWQQTTGRAIFGPLKGTQLEQLHSDELTFALWQAEQPRGIVLKPDAPYTAEYESKQWEQHIARYPSVIDTSQTGISPRELMIGVSTGGDSKAYPLPLVLAEKLIQDRIGADRILLLVGRDNTSVRAFVTQPGGAAGKNALSFIRSAAQPASASDPLMTDIETGSAWSFKGCAVSGQLAGECLTPLNASKDYWFDWLNYHASTKIFKN